MALVVAMQGDQSRTARGVAPGAAPLSPSPYWFEEAIVSSGRSRSSFPAAPYSRSRPPFPPDVIIGIRAIPLSPLARLPIGNGRSRRRPRHGSSTRIASVLPSFAAAVLPGEDSASPRPSFSFASWTGIDLIHPPLHRRRSIVRRQRWQHRCCHPSATSASMV